MERNVRRVFPRTDWQRCPPSTRKTSEVIQRLLRTPNQQEPSCLPSCDKVRIVIQNKNGFLTLTGPEVCGESAQSEGGKERFLHKSWCLKCVCVGFFLCGGFFSSFFFNRYAFTINFVLYIGETQKNSMRLLWHSSLRTVKPPYLFSSNLNCSFAWEVSIHKQNP